MRGASFSIFQRHGIRRSGVAFEKCDGRQMAAVTRLILCAIVMLVTIAVKTGTAQRSSGAEETSGDALAVQLRRQGHRCDGPVLAERDAERSRPDSAVWIVKCANASYRMRLVPDMAAAVEQLD
jgi:hypothetical protein